VIWAKYLKLEGELGSGHDNILYSYEKGRIGELEWRLNAPFECGNDAFKIPAVGTGIGSTEERGGITS